MVKDGRERRPASGRVAELFMRHEDENSASCMDVEEQQQIAKAESDGGRRPSSHRPPPLRFPSFWQIGAIPHFKSSSLPDAARSHSLKHLCTAVRVSFLVLPGRLRSTCRLGVPVVECIAALVVAPPCPSTFNASGKLVFVAVREALTFRIDPNLRLLSKPSGIYPTQSDTLDTYEA